MLQSKMTSHPRDSIFVVMETYLQAWFEDLKAVFNENRKTRMQPPLLENCWFDISFPLYIVTSKPRVFTGL